MFSGSNIFELDFENGYGFDREAVVGILRLRKQHELKKVKRHEGVCGRSKPRICVGMEGEISLKSGLHVVDILVFQSKNHLNFS